MSTSNKLKIFNDPIYGFITIPGPLIFELIEHPYFQRLRRISQMGLSYLVYPGAHHTRFHHALGCMHLMQQVVQILRYKKVEVTEAEEEGLFCAILLHDVGHGPFSHAMESSIVEGIGHEHISLLFMEELNKRFSGRLALALEIFKGRHPKKFLNQLISSQLDMDRLDYLKRDSFYTGVAEGNINSERLITMLNVVDGELVVEEKGIYSVEKFLMARRFMYWQVYLHKTGLVAEQLLIRVLQRAKFLLGRGEALHCSEALHFFMRHQIAYRDFNAENIEMFSKLDDIDVLSAIKNWKDHSDVVLSRLCTMLINRDLLHIKMKDRPINGHKMDKHLKRVQDAYSISREEAGYFVFEGMVENQAYSQEKQIIQILRKNGKLVDVARASDHLNLKALSRSVKKYYICFPKGFV